MKVKDFVREWKVEILFATIALVIIGGYLLLSDRGNAISSVDITISTLDNQSLKDVRVKARELGDGNPDVRMVSKVDGRVQIFNNDGPSYYLYKPSSDKWIKASEDRVAQAFDFAKGFVTSMKDWISGKKEGTYTIEYQEVTLKITINEINPSLPNELFLPPENANV